MGDELLIQISGSLAGALRPSDTIARVGGDEFAILLEGGRDVSDAVRVAERIHDRLTTALNLGGHEVFITASLGIAVHTPEYEKPEDLLRDADTAMYRAKSSGPRLPRGVQPRDAPLRDGPPAAGDRPAAGGSNAASCGCTISRSSISRRTR